MFLTYGEVMLRLAPEGTWRLRQVLPGKLEASFAGAEANVAAALALWGQDVRYVSAVPRTPITECLLATLRSLGVQTSHLLWRDAGRLGIYFVETGANQRGSQVIYDRDASAISLAQPEEYAFDQALEGVRWVHLTGITPALGEPAFRSTLHLAQLAQQRGATVSCDLNFRKKLWRWRPGTKPEALARECMAQVLSHVDVMIANEEDAADVLGIHARGADVARGQLEAAAYADVARQIVTQFPRVRRVATTLRQSVSADFNHWGAMLYDAAGDRALYAPQNAVGGYEPYAIRDIVDRVGGGDSFAAGLLYGLGVAWPNDLQKSLDFAVAASCLKHSIRGDFNYVSLAEVEALTAGAGTGRVQR